MAYEVAIIGAGMAGLAAGVRLAHFGRRVAIFERHSLWGGLNSFYKKAGYPFDVGLHAVTNYVAPGARGMRRPLERIYRQLRIRPEELALEPHRFSRISFAKDQVRLDFENGLERLTQSIAEVFPKEVDAFRTLAARCETYPDALAARPYQSSRAVLSSLFKHPMLVDMLLCPLLFYGSAEEGDVDWDQFVILFNSIYREGMARPRRGVRQILEVLVSRFKEAGGELRMRSGVSRIAVEGGRVSKLVLDSGEEVEAERVISTAGLVETARMRSDQGPRARVEDEGKMAFTEAIFVLDAPAASLGVDAAITFFSDGESFPWRAAADLADTTSGVIACPANFAHQEPLERHDLRVTHLASAARWLALAGDPDAYAAAKSELVKRTLAGASRFAPSLSDHVRYTDAFTPRTVRHYTGHVNGAIYGSPNKQRTGATDLPNLFIAGTDQGLLGIVGAMVSGLSVANAHVLREAA